MASFGVRDIPPFLSGSGKWAVRTLARRPFDGCGVGQASTGYIGGTGQNGRQISRDARQLATLRGAVRRSDRRSSVEHPVAAEGDARLVVLDRDDFVLRGGEMRDRDLALAAEINHRKWGSFALSVFAHHGADLDTLARKACRPHAVVRVSTVGALRAAGYDVADCDDRWHCDLTLGGRHTSADWARLRGLFDRPVENPARSRGCL